MSKNKPCTVDHYLGQQVKRQRKSQSVKGKLVINSLQKDFSDSVKHKSREKVGMKNYWNRNLR